MRNRTKIVDHVSQLRVVPPSQKINLDAGSGESCLGLFDLNLDTAVGQQKGTGMIKQDFHVRCELSNDTTNAGQKNTSYRKLLVHAWFIAKT